MQKTWTELLGKPQGNEMVWGSEIIREVGLHRFKILWTFDNNTQALENYATWVKDNTNDSTSN